MSGTPRSPGNARESRALFRHGALSPRRAARARPRLGSADTPPGAEELVAIWRGADYRADTEAGLGPGKRVGLDIRQSRASAVAGSKGCGSVAGQRDDQPSRGPRA